ncbi:MAG: BON domain-containing protein [Moraxella sp.]|nr:BON domain-containing protein [Moraxella sp.]
MKKIFGGRLVIFGLATLGVVGVLSLTGCASGVSSNPTVDASGAIITGAGRTLPERMIDFGVQRNIVNGLDNIQGLNSDNVRVAATSFRGDVLLTGEVPSEQIKTEIGNMALSIREVKELYNYLTVTDIPKSQSHTNHEKYLQSKIRARLLRSSLKASQYKIVVRNDIVYVMGEMTKEQQDNEIIEVVRNTDGIQGVVLANKILTSSAIATTYGTGSDSVNTNGADDTAVYPSSANHETYGDSYPASMYSGNTAAKPTPTAQNNTTYGGNTPSGSTSSSGYVQLYQGTNKP